MGKWKAAFTLQAKMIPSQIRFFCLTVHIAFSKCPNQTNGRLWVMAELKVVHMHWDWQDCPLAFAFNLRYFQFGVQFQPVHLINWGSFIWKEGMLSGRKYFVTIVNTHTTIILFWNVGFTASCFFLQCLNDTMNCGGYTDLAFAHYFCCFFSSFLTLQFYLYATLAINCNNAQHYPTQPKFSFVLVKCH